MGVNQFTIYTNEEFINQFLTPMESSKFINVNEEAV